VAPRRTAGTDDPQRQAELRKDEKKAAAQVALDLRAVLDLPQGRRVLYRVLELCGTGTLMDNPVVFKPDGRGTDALATFGKLGQLTIGEQLKMDWLALCPQHYEQMMTEGMREHYEADRAHERDKDRGEQEDRDESDRY